MEISDQLINPRQPLATAIKRLAPENPPDQEAQFTDRLICKQRQSQFNQSKVLRFCPKQKLSQLFENLKSNDFLSKLQQQKKQTLKNQWMIMKRIHHKKHKQYHQKNQHTNNIINNVTPKINIQFENASTQIKDNSQSFELQCIRITEKKRTNQKQSKISQKRKRSKTQMLIHNYDLDKIGALEMSSLQQDQHNINNNHHQKINSRQSVRFHSTYSQKSEHKNLGMSEKKKRKYLQQMRETNHISYNEPKVRYKLSEQTHYNKSNNNQQSNHCFTRTRNPISKTLMVQKIINLRKTFNEKYKKTDKKPPIDNSINQSSFNRPDQTSYKSSYQLSSNPIIPYMSFPVMNLKLARRQTFQELFQNQKKKMDLLKKYVNKGGVFNSFVEESKPLNQQGSYQSLKISPNLIDLSQFSQSNLLLTCEHINNSKQLKFEIHPNNLNRGKTKWSDLQKEQIKTIKSRSKVLPQNVQKIQSSTTLEPSKHLENDNIQILPSTIETPQQHVTTYDFDQMKKNLQKPQIKQLRHKYLYSSKRRLLIEEFNKYGISTIEECEKNENYENKFKLKCKTENIMEKCLQIEKKVPKNWDRMGKTSVNFVKSSVQRKKVASLGKQTDCQQRFMQRKGFSQFFEPWQNPAHQQYCEQGITQFPD